LVGLGLHPDSSSGTLNNPLANGKAQARAGILGEGVQAFEESEDLLLVAGIYADAVVLNRKQPLVALPPRGHVDARRVAATVLNRVSDQILKQLFQ
jgi:hypothetical protein